MIRLIEALETRRLLSISPIQLGEKGFDSGYETVVDADGNTIETGIFQHTINFGPSASDGVAVKLTAPDETDIFIVKYNPAGAVLWAGQIGGETSKLQKKPDYPIDPSRAANFITRLGPYPDILGQYVNGVAVDASGNVFLGGDFLETADFDPGPGTYNLTAVAKYQQYYDAYLLKLDPNGKLVWADAFGGQFNDTVNGLSIDPQGNPVVTGFYTRTADFDPTTKGVFTLSNTEGRQATYVAKYTGAGGKLVWADSFGGDATKTSDTDQGNAVAVDSVGNIVVTGTFADKEDFDPGPSVFLLEAEKHTDAYVLELSPRGKRVFADAIGGDDYDGGQRVAVQNGAIYTASYFAGTIDVDPGPATTEITSAGDDRHTDVLISKYTGNGKLIWAKPIGGEGFETIGGFAVAADGSVYTSGGFYDVADFDPGPGTFNLTSTLGDDNFDDPNDDGRDFSYDIYVSRLSTNGKFLSATRIGSSGDDFGTGLALSPDDSTITLTGQFRNTVAFDSADGTNKFKSDGVADGFLINLSDDLKLLT